MRTYRVFQLTGTPALLCVLLLLGTALARPAAAQNLTYDSTRRVYYDPITGYTYGPDLLRTYAPNPGGATVITNSSTNETVYADTPVSVANHTFATTIEATLGNQVIFQQTFALPYADPIVQASVIQANVIFTANGVVPSAPFLSSSSLTNLGSQTTTLVTGQTTTNTTSFTSVFGPVILGPGISAGVPNYPYPFPPDPFYFFVLPGQLDINVNIDNVTTIDRTVTTTTTDLLTQRYSITGAFPAAAVPEPSAWALLSVGVAGVFALRLRKRRQG